MQCTETVGLFITRCLFVPSLSSCHEKAMVALYFRRIHIRLGVVHFQFPVVFEFLPLNLLFVRSHHASRDNHRKGP